MADISNEQIIAALDQTSISDLAQPVVLENDGEPMAVVMGYATYQDLLLRVQRLSVTEARRKARKAVFGDLVGCPLSCGDPIWVPKPTPLWRVPFRHFDGTLMIIVDVDAISGQVSLTEEARVGLLEDVQKYAKALDASSHARSMNDR